MIVRAGKAAKFRAEKGVEVTANGAPFAEGELLSDAIAKPTELRVGTLKLTLIERGDRLGLALEALAAIGIAGGIRRQHFDRDSAIQPRVFGAIHLAHSACAQRRDDLIGPKVCAAR